MVSLKEFSHQLRKIVGPQGRPFVCDGSPIECKVFLVGANPATVMSRTFWDFWSDKTGFDKEAWFRQYLADRASAPLKPGKTRRNAISNTRQRLSWIVEEAEPVSCLETNVFSEASETLAELGYDQRSARIFELLVEAIKPRLLVPHGKDARERIESLSSKILKEEELVQCSIFGFDLKVYPVSHLSRGWSQDAARELGKKLKQIASDECV